MQFVLNTRTNWLCSNNLAWTFSVHRTPTIDYKMIVLKDINLLFNYIDHYLQIGYMRSSKEFTLFFVVVLLAYIPCTLYIKTARSHGAAVPQAMYLYAPCYTNVKIYISAKVEPLWWCVDGDGVGSECSRIEQQRLPKRDLTYSVYRDWLF